MLSSTMPKILVLLLSMSLGATRAAMPILSRGPQTNATCGNNFSWMDNEAGLSPCLVAAYTMSSCGTENFAVLPLEEGTHYDQPGVGGDGVNSCFCSWAGYNLLAACTACQGFEDSITGWAPWKQNCDDKYVSETTYFPFDEDFTIGTTLPYWATQNPLNWTAGRFDPGEARVLADEGHDDVNGTETTDTNTDENNSGGSSTPVGPIVGGVIGGVIVIALAIFGGWWLLRRHKRLTEQNMDESRHTLSTGKPPHSRSVSDFTSTTYPNMSANMMSPSPGPLSPSIMGSGASYFGSIHGTSILMSPPNSPPPMSMMTSAPPMVPMAPQDVIVPFTATHSPNHSLSTNDRKDAMSFSTYDPQPTGGSGQALTDDSFSIVAESTPNRRRVNPPAYSPSAYPTPNSRNTADESVSEVSMSAGMGHRSGKESQDSSMSFAPSGHTRGMSVANPGPSSPDPRVTEFGIRSSSVLRDNDDESAAGVDRPISPPYQSRPAENEQNFDVSRLA